MKRAEVSIVVDDKSALRLWRLDELLPDGSRTLAWRAIIDGVLEPAHLIPNHAKADTDD